MLDSVQKVAFAGDWHGNLAFAQHVVEKLEGKVDVIVHLGDFAGMWEDVRLRPYITAGFTAFVLMIPLALTSTAGWIRRLGGRNWNRLHMLVYITAAAAVLHYYWKVSIKMPPDNPRNYGILVAALLGFRLWRYFARRRASEV